MNFGSGSVIAPPPWENVDRYQTTPPGPGFTQADVLDGLPWPDGTFEVIVANHSLSDLDHHQLQPALVELRRLLAPGGVLRILVPDLLAAVDAYRRGDADWFPLDDDLPTLDERLCCYVGWFGTARSQWTDRYACTLLRAAGFTHLARPAPHQVIIGPSYSAELDDRDQWALIIEAGR